MSEQLQIISAQFMRNSSESSYPVIGLNRALSNYTYGSYWNKAKIHLDYPALSLTAKYKANTKISSAVGTSTLYYLGLSQCEVTEHAYSGNIMPNTVTDNYLNSGYTFYPAQNYFNTSGNWSITITGTEQNPIAAGDWWLYAYDRRTANGSSYLIRNGNSANADYPWSEAGNPEYAPILPSGHLVPIWNGSEWIKAQPQIYNGSEWVEVQAEIFNGVDWDVISV